MLTHENLLANLEPSGARSAWTKTHAACRGSPCTTTWASSAWSSGRCTPGRRRRWCPPLGFLKRPASWLRAISEIRGTHSGSPNFGYELCVQKTTEEDRAALDLSSWEVAFTGAERIRPDTLDRFVRAFGPCGFRRKAFYPCYGLAEATLIVTGGPRDTEPTVSHYVARDLESRRATEVDPNSTSARARRVRNGVVQDRLRDRGSRDLAAVPGWRGRRDLGVRPEHRAGLLEATRSKRERVPRQVGRPRTAHLPQDGWPRVQARNGAVRHEPAQGPDHHPRQEPLPGGDRDLDRAEPPAGAARVLRGVLDRSRRWGATRGGRW